jgi:putative methyltransferase (TIGR04325 family)
MSKPASGVRRRADPSRGPEDFRIWSGIYDRFPNDCDAGGFEDEAALVRSQNDITAALKKADKGLPVSSISIWNQYPLAILLSVISPQGGSVRVLDFGGGMGATYLAVRATLRSPARIVFYVVELREIAAAARAIFADDRNVQFLDDLTDAPDKLDVVHAGSAFQYVDDWQELLREFATREPEFIAFGNLLAGDIEPFVTLQNYWGHQIPVRFHNFDRVMGVLSDLGYQIIFDAFHEQTILGKRQPLPMDNFPKNRRIDYGRNVLLRRVRRAP